MATGHDSEPLVIRKLVDRAQLWGRVLEVVEGRAQVSGAADSEGVIGIVTWTRIARGELTELREVRDRHSGRVVAIVTAPPSVRGARALASHVDGAVLAADLHRTLLPTLAAVGVGQCVIPGSVREMTNRPPLSPRERQVLAMVVLDFSNAEIARKLVVTEGNVKAHLTSAFNKLGVSSRNAAAELILDAESGLGPGILQITPEGHADAE